MTTRALALQLGCTELARARATARGCDCSRAGLPRDCARPAPPPCWLSNHGRASPTHPGRSRPPRLDGSQFASPPALIRIRAALPRGLQTRRWWCRGCRQCMPRGTPLARGRAGQCLSRNISQPGQPGHVTAHTCSSRLTLTLILALTRRRQQRAPRGGSPQEVQADEVRRHPLRTVDGERAPSPTLTLPLPLAPFAPWMVRHVTH